MLGLDLHDRHEGKHEDDSIIEHESKHDLSLEKDDEKTVNHWYDAQHELQITHGHNR